MIGDCATLTVCYADVIDYCATLTVCYAVVVSYCAILTVGWYALVFRYDFATVVNGQLQQGTVGAC